jgi:hypothetical protein
MNIINNIFDLIIEAEQAPPPQEAAPPPPVPPKSQEAPPEPEPQQEAPPPPPPVPIKAPPQIKSFITKMIKDFGDGGKGKSLDMKYMRQARETLGVNSKFVSKLIEKIQDGDVDPNSLLASVQKTTPKF